MVKDTEKAAKATTDTTGKAVNETETGAKEAGHSTAKAAGKAGKETKKAAKKTSKEVKKGAKEVTNISAEPIGRTNSWIGGPAKFVLRPTVLEDYNAAAPWSGIRLARLSGSGGRIS